MTSSPQVDAAHDPILGTTVGGYIVEEPLGQGGMGLVYRARHPILNRRFAVKVLRPEAAADVLVSGNFVREAQTLSSLKHPHIIDIVDFGALDEKRQYMVMEFLEGKTLEVELDEKGRMPPERALSLADQILDALSAAHSVDIVHRDLKPSNVFLARVSGGRELLKLLDFGLAKQQPTAMLAHVAVAEGASVASGTPEYVAPEQALGKQASRYSDLYSFGVMLFELLTGDVPFRARANDPDRIRTLLKLHVNQPAPSLSSVTEPFAFPHELEVLVAELLNKDPAERPSSAEAVRNRLQRVKRGLARRDPLLELPVELMAARREVEHAQLVRPRIDTVPMFSPLEEPVLRRRSLGRWAAIAVLPLLVGGVCTWQGSQAPVVLEEEEAPVVEEISAPPMVSAVIAEPEFLSPLVKTERPRPSTPLGMNGGAPTAVNRARVEIRRTACEPNERWRQSSRAHLQELQQAAARSSNPRAWAQFEATEPVLSAAIARASTGVECDAVDHDIQKLAGRFTQ